MTKLFIATSGASVGIFPNVLPLLALQIAVAEYGSHSVVDIGLKGSLLRQFVECERLSLFTPVAVAPDIFRAHSNQDVVLFNAECFGDDDVFRLVLLKHAANPELDRQGRRAIAFVPFDDNDAADKERAHNAAFSFHQSGFNVRLVYSSPNRQGYSALVRGIAMTHSCIPPLGNGLIELIEQEKRTLWSLIKYPPDNFHNGVEHIKDWLRICRLSNAFCDLHAAIIPRPEQMLSGSFPNFPSLRAHSFWRIDTLADAADDPAKL